MTLPSPMMARDKPTMWFCCIWAAMKSSSLSAWTDMGAARQTQAPPPQNKRISAAPMRDLDTCMTTDYPVASLASRAIIRQGCVSSTGFSDLLRVAFTQPSQKVRWRDHFDAERFAQNKQIVVARHYIVRA